MANEGCGRTSIIALLTDFKWRNWYVGVMKGVIVGINPAVHIVDLCHDVSSQDVREGSFVLGNSFGFFPHGTIFIAVVDPGVGSDRKNLIVTTDHYTFVAPDNGILSSIFEKAKVERVYHVSPGQYTLSPRGSTFFGRDIFAPVAAHLSLGVPPERMGGEVKSVLTVAAIRPFVNESGELSGRAVYVDTFGNIITNIDEGYIKGVFPGVPFERLTVRLMGHRMRGIRKYYEEGESGKLMTIINSWGYMEVALNMGNAFQYLGLKEKKSLEIFVNAAP